MILCLTLSEQPSTIALLLDLQGGMDSLISSCEGFFGSGFVMYLML
jgi:hypothetical protein